MNIFKAIISFFIVILFTMSAAMLQFFLALSSTALSPSYFGNIVTKSNISQEFSQYAFQRLDDFKFKGDDGQISTEGTRQALELVSILKGYIDTKWLESQVSILITGLHSYLTDSDSKLPQLDIIPLKSAMMEILVMQVAKHGGADESDETKAVISSELSKKIKYEDMKDSLDLNILAEALSYKGYNFIKGIKTIALTIKETLLLTLSLISALLTAALVLIHFKAKYILRWIGASFIASGLSILVSYNMASNYIPLKKLSELKGFNIVFNQAPELSISTYGFIQSLVDGFIKYLLVLSAVLLSLGVLLIIITFFKLTGARPVEAPKNKKFIRALRAFAILIVLLMLPVTLGWGYKRITNVVYEFKAGTGGSDTLKSIYLQDALSEAIGAEFLKKMHETETKAAN